ncbi:uncharacterized protein KIAA1958 homolog isoform X1 [Conger conger]|uniref:uncharacterized protein KIAA1958 homolog isoform X1 n=1 Tax=Conger conger TaxID=82655 RepID=UPI002A59E9FB|nr:uncharacterized protein KIAA1958 homolog isoform X1 [Conger conger]XP_061119040.1 uncharacterized protein KIAA1958 homolog isoform X1 [Conger conger]XP_061119041.1 uncharacterized protein KIAA1958 homolog isoform X1 [Conger conger]XP_061119042.1 uncharacterized protein KIAA1958 homolog isoform X1 [Conger conger]
MEDCLHTSSENLSKLVSWAHSHGTICSLIPGLKHLLTEGSHGNLTAMWGCSAGHAYHWPLTATCRGANPNPKDRCCPDPLSPQSSSALQPSPAHRFLARGSKGKGRDSCELSNCSEPSEAEEDYSSGLFDIVCESSATDEDGEFEPQLQSAPRPPLRKRPPPVGRPRLGEAAVKKIKQESQEDYYIVADAQLGGGLDGPALSQGAPPADPTAPSPSPPGTSPPGLPKPLRPPPPCSQGRAQGPAPASGRAEPHHRPPVPSQPPNLPSTLPLLPPPLPNLPLLPPPLPGHGELVDSLPPPEELPKSCGLPQPYGDPDSSPVCLNPDLEIISPRSLSAEPKAEASDMEERQAEANREQNEKTIRSTQTALRNFRDFLISKYPSETREIYCIPCGELDAYLASFFVDARQKDGSEYEPNSLANYQCGLERYLKEQRYRYSITRDKEFRRSQEALKQKQLELKFKGKGNKPHKSMKLTFADELILRKRGLLSRFNPEGLLNLVWLNNTKAFGHCTGFHGSSLKWGDVRLIASETGLECLEWSYQEYIDGNTRTKRPGTECRIYATPHAPQTCPVQDYKEYAQRRPQAMLYEDAPFYLSIKPVVNLAALHWYNSQALGKNKLAKMVKTMCEKGNIPGRKTNFSVYQSCSTLSEAQSNQLVLICNNLSQQASQARSSHPGATNFVITGSFDSDTL